MPKVTQEELVLREMAIGEKLKGLGDHEIIEAIAADRVARWLPVVAAITVPEAIGAWAVDMANRYGPNVQIWRNTVGWVTALIIARYGEAEYHWPDALGPEDLNRALRWYRGDTPEGVKYLPKES